MTTPILKALKELIPRCHVTYATDLQYARGALGEVILHNPYVDELIPNDDIREGEYDYSVDITSTGLSRERSGTVPPNRIDMFAEEVGISVASDPVPIYEITAEEREEAKAELTELIPNLAPDTNLIAVQARSNDARRTWPLGHVERLVEILSAKPNTHVLLFDWGNTVSRWKKDGNPQLHLMMSRSLSNTAGINYYPNTSAICLGLPCFPCVAGDSYVLTDKGYKAICEIQPGEKAYTANGEFKEITEIHRNSRNGRQLHDLQIFGSNETSVLTEDHKMLISQRRESWKQKDWKAAGAKKRKAVVSLSKPTWTAVRDIKAGDYCCIPLPQTSETDTHVLLSNTDLAWLVGFFIAEGWTELPKGGARSYNARFAIGATETHFTDRIREIVSAHPNIFHSDHYNKGFVSTQPNSCGDSTIVTISNKSFVTLLHNLFGMAEGKTINKANRKHIPYPLLRSKNDIISSFLLGLQQGNGCEDGKDIVYSTASRELAYGIQLLCCKVGIFPKIYRRIRDTNFKKDAVIYRIYQSRATGYKRWYRDEQYIYAPVKENNLSERTDETVFDITVEDDPTFTMQNISVLDCWYSPVCNSGNSKLDCLTRITPEEVEKAVMKKLIAPVVSPKSIIRGSSLTSKGQDPVILVRRTTKGIGDILMTTPSISALYAQHPDKEIHVACQKELWPVLQNHPAITKLVDSSETPNYKRYFMVIDISSSCARYESARIASGRPVQKSRVEIFAEAMNVRDLIRTLKPEYHVTPEETEWAKDFLSKTSPSKKPKLAIGLRSAEIYRDWPEQYYKRLFALLRSKFDVVLIDHSRQHIYHNVIDACGFSLRQAAAIMSLCDGLITVDTSLLHFGAALDIPTVALFGPIDGKARCKGYDNVTVAIAGLDCIPCWRNGMMPCKVNNIIKGYSKCMESMSPKAIAQLIKKKLEVE
jgi:ADP-heptose:LPS heptosyltransferase/intein/homing endonuclease